MELRRYFRNNKVIFENINDVIQIFLNLNYYFYKTMENFLLKFIKFTKYLKCTKIINYFLN